MNYNTPTTEEMVTISTFVGRRRFGIGEIQVMAGIYNRIFNAREQAKACGNCVKRLISGLERVYNENKDRTYEP